MPLGETIQALRFERFGDPAEVLRLERVPLPVPGAGQVRLRMAARPINPADLLLIRGRYGVRPTLPAIPGTEGVGVIEALAPDVTGVKAGDRVFPVGASGTWAEAMLAPADGLVAVPAELADEIACQAIVNPMTAYLLLFEALAAKPGDWVVQTAARSALGRMVAQLCRSNGINLINIVRGNTAGLDSVGNDKILSSDDEDLAARIAELARGEPVLRAIDAVGGALTGRVAEALGYGGRLVVYGKLSGEPMRLDASRLIFKKLNVGGFWLRDWLRTAKRERRQEVVDTVLKLLSRGTLTLQVGASFTLASFHSALERAAEPGRMGKILLVG